MNNENLSQEDNRDSFFSNEYSAILQIPEKYDNKPPKKPNFGKELYSWLQIVIESIMAAFLMLIFFLNLSVVSGSSMEPTLKENDRLVIIKAFYEPEYGDIVALWAENLFNSDTGEMGELIVKRVIGLPGDVIDVNAVSGIVYRNDVPLEEDYIKETINPDCLGNVHYPVTVDENCVFVLGDNRNHSTDSRYVKDDRTLFYVGCVDEKYILGKAVYRIYPYDRIGAVQ